MILVAVDELRDGAIDLDLHLAVRADGGRLLKHQLGRAHAILLPPRRRGADAAPPRPAGIPIAHRIRPPIARPVKPIPRPGGEPAVVEKVTLHLDFHRGLRDRRAVVVVRGNSGLEGFSERHGLSGGIHLHLVFRLLVFLDAEREIRVRDTTAGDSDVVVPQCGLFLEIEIEFDAPKCIRTETFFLNDQLVAPIADLDVRCFSRVGGNLAEIIARLARPEFHINFLAGAVNRPVGDADGFLRKVVGAVTVVAPLETVAGKEGAAFPGAGDHMPLEQVAILLHLIEDELAVGVRAPFKISRDDLKAALALRLFQIIRAKTEELQLARHGAAVRRIDEVKHLVARLGTFQ